MEPPNKKMPQSVKAKSIVHLNVGGESFTTLYKTLSVSIFFQNLLNGVMNNKTITGDGSIFIDRDGRLFRDVLLYLRTSMIFTKDRDKLHSLLLEAQFYQIEELESRLVTLLDETAQQGTAQPAIIWKKMDEINSNLGSTTFLLTEKTKDVEKSYQILDIVNIQQPSNYCSKHQVYSCPDCAGVKFVLISRDL
ncbi:BTB/POZ domain-containing protein kctd21 [Mucor circinelloides]